VGRCTARRHRAGRGSVKTAREEGGSGFGEREDERRGRTYLHYAPHRRRAWGVEREAPATRGGIACGDFICLRYLQKGRKEEKEQKKLHNSVFMSTW
jgi:hypothetical protein